mmetsp:Transcript_18753/g.51522  ORF Transcript_18753/g.51522 Transcript_18753/m.51522 type:complete len:122 (-) Transcript_18753:286-651(-)
MITFIIIYLSKWNDIHWILSRRSCENITTVIPIVQIIIGMGYSQSRTFHTCRISTGDEISCTSITTRFCMKKHFSWSSVDHWCRPDCHDSSFCIQHSFIDDSFVLFDSDVKRYIIFLSPTT